MGVQGLWSILESTGQPVSPDSLRGKILAVDVSIWLHQAVKGYRDKDGNPLPSAHLLGVFHRICKLIHYGIRPVFVFDGGVPALKRQTMSGRRQRKMEASSKAVVARTKLLSNYLQQHLQRESSKTLPPTIRMATRIQAMGKLPSTSPSKSPQKNSCTEELDLVEFRHKLDWDEMDEEDDEWSEEDDLMMTSRNYADHFSTITSAHFDSLDLETQHEILFQMQESKKTNSWATMGEMPREAGEFSSFQMDRLLKRRFLQKKIQSVQKEMGQRHIHVQNLDELATYEAEFGTEAEIVSGSKDKGALLLKPKLTPTSPINQSGTRIQNPSSSTSGRGRLDGDSILDIPTRGRGDEDGGPSNKNLPKSRAAGLKMSEEEADMERAIQLSLEDNQESMDKDHDPLVVLEERDQELETAIQLSLESEMTLKRGRSPSTRSPPKSAQGRNHHEGSPTKVPNSSWDRNEKPFEQSIADDMSSACYKFLGWVGFNDKVIPSSSSSPSKLSQPQPLLGQIKKRISEDDFEEVEGHFDVVHEKSFVSHGHVGFSEPTPTSHPVTLPSVQELQSTSSDEEDEFEDVVGEVEPMIQDEESLVSHLLSITPLPLTSSTQLQIRISEKSQLQDDLFGDIFGNGDKFTQISTTPTQSGGNLDMETQNPSKIPTVTLVSDKGQSDRKEFEERGMKVRPEIPSTCVPVVSEVEKEIGGGDERIERTLGRIPTQATPPSSAVRMISSDFMQRQERLNAEEIRLKGQMGDQDRLSASITDQMYSEAQELLSLFGIPFVVSPMEAEAQCAFLDSAAMTDGTLTDDSDIWLFGALRVYKNFFAQGDRHVQFFQYADIVRKLYLDREKLILVAMLSGSDYTNGIEGVGPVTALEIIGESGFHGERTFDTLSKFYEWWSTAQETRDDVGNKLREKWKKLRIGPGFPSQVVYDAYMDPTIDASTEPFRWGSPDLDSLRHYARNRFGWDQSKTDSILGPALKNFTCQDREVKRQTTLDSFLRRLDEDHHPLQSGQSKRLQRAMKRLKGHKSREAPHEVDLSSDSDSTEEAGTEGKGKRKVNKSRGAPSAKRKKLERDEGQGSDGGHPMPKGSASPIPQRVKTQAEREGNKRRAIQVLKKEKEKEKGSVRE